MPPNRLGYCGPAESWKVFQKFISNPNEENAATAQKQLKHFTALFPYLELIADANSLKPFDLDVIEAYWTGNSLLENVSYSEIQKTILSFQNFGLPKSIAEKKASQLPKQMLPNHCMHVLYINFISQKVKPIVQNLSNCLVQWAKVIDETPKEIRAKGIELFQEAGQLKLKEKEKTLQNPFGLKLKTNNFITVHWDNAIELVSKECQKKLESYTFKNIEMVDLFTGNRK